MKSFILSHFLYVIVIVYRVWSHIYQDKILFSPFRIFAYRVFPVELIIIPLLLSSVFLNIVKLLVVVYFLIFVDIVTSSEIERFVFPVIYCVSSKIIQSDHHSSIRFVFPVRLFHQRDLSFIPFACVLKS